MQATLCAYPAELTEDEIGNFVVHFPDLPEALTSGGDMAEALTEASDCLSEALAGRIVDKEVIPRPSAVRSGQYQVAPEPMIALKAALYSAMREHGVTVAKLARELGIGHKEARRLLSPRHRSRLAGLQEALALMGYEVLIAVDNSRNAGLDAGRAA